VPLYFSDVAPTCPVSHDEPSGPQSPFNRGRPQLKRPAIPHAYDLSSAINAANYLRQLLSQINNIQTRNNVKTRTQFKYSVSVAPDKFKNTAAHWVEQKKKRVRQKYKYYGTTADGKEDKQVWVVMERIERMVWYDKGWKSYMIWEYGDKGEGEPVGGPKVG